MVEQKKKTVTKKTVGDKPKTAKAAVKPAEKKTATKKTSSVTAVPKNTKPAAVKKVSATSTKQKAPASKTTTKLTPEARYRMVETAAYYIAEKHGFQGRSDEHWVAAERQIAKLLGQ